MATKAPRAFTCPLWEGSADHTEAIDRNPASSGNNDSQPGFFLSGHTPRLHLLAAFIPFSLGDL